MSNQAYPSAVHSANFTGDDNKKVPGNKGAHIYFAVTAVPGVDTVQMIIEAKDQVSGQYETLISGAASALTHLDAFTIFPGITETANVDISDPLPDIYRVRVVHSAATAFTYSINVVEIE